MKGIVLKSVGSWYLVKLENGTQIQARLKGKFKLDDKKLTNPIAVGDRVELLFDPHRNDYSIEDIHPRSNYIIRVSPHKKEHAHLIACNIDLAIIIVTLTKPETSFGFIDRFLVSAESFQIPAAILINKIDLITPRLEERLQLIHSTYPLLGYKVLETSCNLGTGIDAVRLLLQSKNVLLTGHSGVGKSTLINLLTQNVQQKTAPISNFAEKGVHTTTFAEMFDLGAETYLIDTPGIKEFGLYDIDKNELNHFFPEMRALIGSCKFNSCLHVSEPCCNVIAGVEAGTIALSRYQSYLSMLSGNDNRK